MGYPVHIISEYMRVRFVPVSENTEFILPTCIYIRSVKRSLHCDNYFVHRRLNLMAAAQRLGVEKPNSLEQQERLFIRFRAAIKGLP